jgi:hypothetical protein
LKLFDRLPGPGDAFVQDEAMQTHMPRNSSTQQPQQTSPLQALAPRGERGQHESRPIVALEPHWSAAIDAATD